MTGSYAPDVVADPAGFIVARCPTCPWQSPPHTDTDRGRDLARIDYLDHTCTPMEGDPAA